MHSLLQKIVDKLRGIEFRHETKRTVPDVCLTHGLEYWLPSNCMRCADERERSFLLACEYDGWLGEADRVDYERLIGPWDSVGEPGYLSDEVDDD